MEIAIFSKKRTGRDGKTFYNYLSTLTRKDGTKQSVQVKFREACGNPKADACPMNIKVSKKNCNLSTRDFVREDTGDCGRAYTLWVSDWEIGSPYVDTSMDEFDTE